MGAKQWIGLAVVALGLLLIGWFWKQGRPQAEAVHREPAVVAQPDPSAAGLELATLHATEVSGERLALDATASTAQTRPSDADREAGKRVGFWVEVVDEQRQPLEGVRVVLRSRSDASLAADSEGTSSNDGRVWLAANFRAEPVRRRVEPAGPGLGKFGVDVDLSRLDDAPVVLVLGIGAALDVHVIDEGGASTEGATVHLVTPADFDAGYGTLSRVDSSRAAQNPVRSGVVSFEGLPPHTDLLLHVRSPPPLGPLSLRTRTPGPGQRTSVEARYSAEDVVLLGDLRGALDDADWGWSLFHPGAPPTASFAARHQLHVAEDGHFLVRLSPELWRGSVEGSCLVLRRGWDLLEAVELPPLTAPGVVRLEPIEAEESVLCAGSVFLESDGNPTDVELAVVFQRHSETPVAFHAASNAHPDASGQFSLPGRVPAAWKWSLTSRSKEWEVVEPAAFQPGTTDHRVEVARVGGVAMGRLVPGPTLAASKRWTQHLVVQLRANDGSRDRVVLLDADGRFELALPVEQIGSVAVRSRWHDRPILEGNAVPNEPLELVLPPDLRLVELDVRGEGGTECDARALDPSTYWSDWYQAMPASPLVLLLDRPAQDVLVKAEGYRDTLVSAVSQNRRVDLVEKAIPVRLRALDLPELPQEFRLRPLLSRGPGSSADFSSAAAFDSRGEAITAASGVGDFYVHLQLERVSPLMRTAHPIDGAESPRIQVSEPNPDDGPAEFTVTFDTAKILEILARSQ